MRALLLQKVPAAGGAELATDVYLPDGPGPFPVLLTRTPYHRAGAAAGAARYVDAGYARVIQDARGKYDSTGVFRPLLDEADDGAAALDWVAEQRWCNGRIGLVGASYLGMVQVPAAAGGHEALRCIAPAVAPNSYFIDWIRHDGCFALANAVRWPMTHAVCPTKPTEHFQWSDLWSQPTLEDVFDRAGYRCEALEKWIAHDRYDDYWRAADQHRMYPRVKVPGLHVAGWFDHISRGQFQAYCGIRDGGDGEAARTGQRLLVGPWGHRTMGQSAYGLWDFGEAAETDLRARELRFLDLHMKDVDDGISADPPVRLFLMGANRWMDFADWPVPGAEMQAFHLRAAGGLSPETPDAEMPDEYRYDPADPVPTLGGPIYWGMGDDVPVGPADQAPILARSDVLCYRSDPLGRALAVIGGVGLDLWVASSAEDTDFIAKLCVVEPGGRVVVLTVGSLRCRYRNGWEKCEPLPRGEPVEIRIHLGNLAYVFPESSRVALIVTSSSYPRILPHPNTMAPTWHERSPRPADQQVLHDRRHPSRLLLPVVDL